MPTKNSRALVLLSGGLDSATCLYYALSKGYDVSAISFDYGQRHQIEISYAKKLAITAQIKEHTVFKLDLRQVGGSALTDNIEVPKGGQDLGKENLIPVTYVPGRNLIFLSIASAMAEAKEITNLFIGANILDYSGYPDCRPDFFDAFVKTLGLATKTGREGRPIKIHTPLLQLSKKEIINMAQSLGLPIELTWSCYDPQEESECGKCDACILRNEALG